ncbi:MAG: ArnT family glycosyltransferase [Flavisolibacter sp.]
MNSKRIPAELLIVAGAALLFLPFLGSVHLFDWDEINFAEESREMLITHNYFVPQINFIAFWEKPPLFFWLQLACMKCFGVNEFAARFPNVVCGMITLLILFRLGRKLVNEQFGWTWIFVYVASLLPQMYFRSGIIDPWFNLFIFLSLFHLILYSDEKNEYHKKHILLAGFFAGLAMMTKGPVAVLILALCYGVYQISTRFRNFIKPVDMILFILLSMVIGGIWFIALLMQGQGHVILNFFQYQLRLLLTGDATHGGPFYYHFLVLLIGCVPAAALAILAMVRSRRNPVPVPLNFYRWMMILFWVVLLLFSIVRTKIVHYSSLCYIPLTFFAAHAFYTTSKNNRLPSWNRWLQFLITLVLALALLMISFLDSFKPWLLRSGIIKDPFAIASLQARVDWNWTTTLPGLILLAGSILFIFLSRNNPRRALIALFCCTLIGFNLATLLIVPRAEVYSQNAAIEFYQSKQNEQALVETLDFFSYANLFYTRRVPRKEGYTIKGHPPYPVYFVGKIQNEQADMQLNPRLQKLYEKNGFVFYIQR